MDLIWILLIIYVAGMIITTFILAVLVGHGKMDSSDSFPFWIMTWPFILVAGIFAIPLFALYKWARKL